MSLLCALGRHSPRGIPRWNDGFYFATCERCGCDLVRTAFQRWHVPTGYRVVWSDRPPASRPDVALIPVSAPAAPAAPSHPPAEAGNRTESAPAAAASAPEPPPGHPASPAAPSLSPEVLAPPPEPVAPDDRASPEAPAAPAGSHNGRLPIQDVLAHLNAEDAAKLAGETPVTPANAPARLRPSTWDFMDDDPLDDDARSGVVRRRPSESAAATGAPPPVDPEKEPSSLARVGRSVGERWDRVRSAIRNFSSGPAEPKPLLVIGLAFALAVAVAAAVALYSAGTSRQPSAVPDLRGNAAEGAENGVVPDPFAASDPEVSTGDAERPELQEGVNGPAGGEAAYVAASLLSCRAAPVLQARRVRNLARGEEVRVLGRDGEWASLAYRGGQCWARARFLSPVPPL
jgi:hypothetical protein